MNKAKSILSLFMIATFLNACAQKDSEYAEKYLHNAAGGEAVDTQEAQAAGEAAEEKGYRLDIADIKKKTSNGHSQVTVTLVVNDQQFSVTSGHYYNASYGASSLKVEEGSQKVGDLIVQYHAVCANASCNPFYVSAEIFAGQQLQVQTGMRKYFDELTKTKVDRYQHFTAEKAKKLVAGSALTNVDLNNYNVMVGYLNSKDNKSGK